MRYVVPHLMAVVFSLVTKYKREEEKDRWVFASEAKFISVSSLYVSLNNSDNKKCRHFCAVLNTFDYGKLSGGGSDGGVVRFDDSAASPLTASPS